MERERALVRELDERRLRVRERVGDERLAADRHALDPRRVVLLHVLLKEAAAGEAFRVALDRQRPAGTG